MYDLLYVVIKIFLFSYRTTILMRVTPTLAQLRYLAPEPLVVNIIMAVNYAVNLKLFYIYIYFSSILILYLYFVHCIWVSFQALNFFFLIFSPRSFLPNEYAQFLQKWLDVTESVVITFVNNVNTFFFFSIHIMWLKYADHHCSWGTNVRGFRGNHWYTQKHNTSFFLKIFIKIILNILETIVCPHVPGKSWLPTNIEPHKIIQQ